MPESLPESLNVSASIWVWNCLSLRLRDYNIVFLICLMFTFERPIQITLFQIHLVSVIRCVTCQVRFSINYWRVWLYLVRTNQASRGHFACTKQWRNKGCTMQNKKQNNKTTTKNQPILRLGDFVPSNKEIVAFSGWLKRSTIHQTLDCSVAL